MQKILFILAGFLLFLLVSTSCSKFQKIQKSNDLDKKYQAALNYYKNKEYSKAGLLFEELIPILRGTKESELAQFYYAYTQYYQGLYDLSAFQFKKFYETFSRSEFAQEAMLMYAYSLYENSPAYNLDQTNTYSAIEAMQNFINAYPTSERVKEATDIIEKLRDKLEKKAFENAELYSRMQDYKAAVISLTNFQRDFPDSEYGERAAYLKVLNAYNLAKSSTKAKEKERYEEAIEFYENFIDKYAKSKYLRDAENMYEESIEKVGSAAGAELQSKQKEQ